MIDGDQYIETVEDYFKFLTTEFGFEITERKVRGNTFYDVQYRDEKLLVSISYENIEDYLMVTIFLLQSGGLPDYDDKTKTIHLKSLNAKVLPELSRNEISMNNEYFFSFIASGEIQQKLLKSAKELRLCLKHFKRSEGLSIYD